MRTCSLSVDPEEIELDADEALEQLADEAADLELGGEG
jgi:hypothetical protein